MKSFIKFKIITPEKVVYQDEISEITIPTEYGEITILPNHTPLVTLAVTGEIRIRKENIKDLIPLSISSGVVEIKESSIKDGQQTEIIILASRSELASEIDINRAKEAYDRALKITEEKKHSVDVDFARFEALLDKEANRVKIYTKWHK
jgi:F-type H+-transporting ATPase subunit epsilon